MNDLISREELTYAKKVIKRQWERAKGQDIVAYSTAMRCIKEIENSTTQQPVVHGRWVWSPEYCKWICSVCAGREGECETPVCKWCGARMGEGR
ncbi:hypothetical protein LI291_10605 [Intestinibacillus massiliensis]|nr:hypothetical protein [Intestinibacillus massiliensis]